MNILVSPPWKDYELLDSGNGMRFEQFGPYRTIRPDPQAIWQPTLSQKEWEEADVQYVRTQDDKGVWKFKRAIPEKWKMTYKTISFWARLTSFKHTGVFPEQNLQWDWITSKIESRMSKVDIEDRKLNVLSTIHRPPSNISVLNLFGYTGIATLVASRAGAKVTHVDASKPSLSWARENQILSGLESKPIRWILDDCVKFVEREIRRGVKYDGILMDPPVYGHGVSGQIWKFSESFPKLMALVREILSPNPLFVIVNAYAISSSALMLGNVMEGILSQSLPAGRQGTIEVGELCLREKFGKRLLSTGMYARWSK